MTGSEIIVVGFDFSEQGGLALDQAIRLTSYNHATLHVVHVTPQSAPTMAMDGTFPRIAPTLDDIEKSVAERVKLRLAAIGKRGIEGAVVHVRTGGVGAEICAVATQLEADLIIVGTHGRQGVVRLLLGSVAEEVVRTANCPVLVVRPKTTADVPEIEKACPDCVVARQESAGRELWCEQHKHNLGRRHTYHYVPRTVSSHENMPLITGTEK
jgi:nucleotide-binding universal stress UspA family protein